MENKKPKTKRLYNPGISQNIKTNKPQLDKIYWEGELLNSDFFEIFKNKQFARNLMLNKMDLVKAYTETFGENETVDYKKIKQAARYLTEREEVQHELLNLAPTDREVAAVLKQALTTPTPKVISWADKHKYVETVMEAKGYIKKKEKENDASPNLNINMVIER